MTNVLEAELILMALKWQKYSEISVGKITGSLPIITDIRFYRTNCKYSDTSANKDNSLRNHIR